MRSEYGWTRLIAGHEQNFGLYRFPCEAVSLQATQSRTFGWRSEPLPGVLPFFGCALGCTGKWVLQAIWDSRSVLLES